MRIVNVLAIIAMTGLSLTLFQNCSKAKFADSDAGLLEQSSLSASTITINYDAVYTNDTNVRVQVNLEKPMWMYVTNTPGCANGGVWQQYAPEIPWVLGEKNKETQVFVKFKTDYTESACNSDSIIHDDIIPTLSLIGSAPLVTNAGSVNLAFAAADVGSGVDHMVCPAEVPNCGNAVAVLNSVEGQKNSIFYLFDKAGNKSLPLTVSWLYDKTGPVISFNQTPGSKSKETVGNFVILAQDNFSAAADIKYKRSLDGGAYTDVSSSFSVTVGEGDHTVAVMAYDKAGNKSNTISYAWTVGTKIPTLQFTKTPKAYDNSKASFEFSGNDQFNAPLVKYECSLNNSAFAVCSSPYDLTNANLVAGANKFVVRGTDNLGLYAEIPYNWVFDNNKPVLAFTLLPKPFSNSPSEEVRVSTTEVNLDTIEFIIDGASKQKGSLTNYLMSNLVQGKHTIRAIAVDKAGNSSDPIDASFWSDFTAPVVSPVTLAAFLKNPNQTINVTATDNNTDPANLLSYFYQLDLSGSYAQFTPPLQLAALGNGNHQILVYAIDKAGNKSAVVASNNFYIDLFPPVISIVKKPADSVATGSVSVVSFTVTDIGSGVKSDSLVCSLTKASGTVNYPCAAGADISIDNNEASDFAFTISVSDNLLQQATSTVRWNAANMFMPHSTNFNVSMQVNNKVDILFLVGNDQSMPAVLKNISAAFGNFLSKIQGLDWRIAITTTDTGGNNAGSQGNILQFGSSGLYFLQPTTAGAQQLFQDNLVVNVNQAQNALKDQGLTAVQNFLVKATGIDATNEKSFLRSDAVLATIIVDHSDETNSRGTVYGTADLYLNALYAKLGSNKPYINHSSIVLPNDSACLAQAGSIAYGRTYYDVSAATGGVNASVCTMDYGNQLNNFGNSILTKVSQIQLDCSPVDQMGDGKVDVAISYKATSNSLPVMVDDSSYQVNNNVIRFINPPNNTGDYTVNYTCLSKAP